MKHNRMRLSLPLERMPHIVVPAFYQIFQFLRTYEGIILDCAMLFGRDLYEIHIHHVSDAMVMMDVKYCNTKGQIVNYGHAVIARKPQSSPVVHCEPYSHPGDVVYEQERPKCDYV